MNRAYVALNIKAVDEDARRIEGWATTAAVDRVGDVVLPKGASYSLPLPFLLDHDHRQVVGEVDRAEVSANGIKFWAHIKKIPEPGEVKDLCDKAWALVKHGLRKSVSIGFNPMDFEAMPNGGLKFTKWEWLELSAVGVPANAEAEITNVKNFSTGLRYQTVALPDEFPPDEASGDPIKSIDAPVLAATGKEPKASDRPNPPGGSGSKQPAKPGRPPMAKTIAEQIAGFEASRVAKAARMTEIMDKSAEEGVTLDAEQAEEYDGLESELKAIESHMARLATLERAQAAKAKSIEHIKDARSGSDARSDIIIKAPRKLDKGIEFARFAMCLAAGKGNLMQSYEIAKSKLADSDDVVNVIKAAVAAGTTTDATWASPLVDSYQRFTGDFVEFLRPQTIIGRFGTDGIPSLRRIPFNVSIVGQTSGGSGYWVGEGAPKPLTKFDFNATNLRWAKVANIAVLTEEMIRFSDPSAEALVRDALAAALIERLDTDFVDPAKAVAANVSPASITNGVTPIPSSGNDVADVKADVRALMATFIAANVGPRSAVWIMSATTALALSLMEDALGNDAFEGITMEGGRFQGFPVIVSEYVPSDSDGAMVILANASDIWLADDGQVMLDASREASLQMLDNPTNHSGTATPTTMVSMFQTNSVALRAERYINWQKRRASAVAVLSGVNWGQPTAS